MADRTGYLRSRAYRLSHADQRDRERRMNAARQRALVQLRRLYPDDFRRLYLTELEVAGVTTNDGQADG